MLAGHSNSSDNVLLFVMLCIALCLYSLWYASSHIILEVGRVPDDYPVPAGYCTTRHYPDPAKYYFIIWPDTDPGNLSGFLRLSTIPPAVKRKVGICLATVFDARHCGVTRDR